MTDNNNFLSSEDENSIDTYFELRRKLLTLCDETEYYLNQIYYKKEKSNDHNYNPEGGNYVNEIKNYKKKTEKLRKDCETIENANKIIKLENSLKERKRIYENLKKENVYLIKLKGEVHENEIKLSEENKKREDTINVNEKITTTKSNIKVKKDYLELLQDKNKIYQNKIKLIESKCKLINENIEYKKSLQKEKNNDEEENKIDENEEGKDKLQKNLNDLTKKKKETEFKLNSKINEQRDQILKIKEELDKYKTQIDELNRKIKITTLKENQKKRELEIKRKNILSQKLNNTNNTNTTNNSNKIQLKKQRSQFYSNNIKLNELQNEIKNQPITLRESSTMKNIQRTPFKISSFSDREIIQESNEDENKDVTFDALITHDPTVLQIERLMIDIENTLNTKALDEDQKNYIKQVMKYN